MPERCAISWKLFREVEKQQLRASTAGYVIDDSYPPYFLALQTYQTHFRNCEQCRAWVDSWTDEGAKNEIFV